MKRDRFTTGMRNKLSEISMSCDSAAAIEGSQMSGYEREHIRKGLRELIAFIDDRIRI